MTEIEELNKAYEGKAIGVYPFLSKHRITILEKGYYTKNKANYRGLTYVFDKNMGENKALLIGYYYVPEDYIIIPEGVDITEGKQSLIDVYSKKGYVTINTFPSLKPIQFDESTKEFEAAYNAYINYKTQKVA